MNGPASWRAKRAQQRPLSHQGPFQCSAGSTPTAQHQPPNLGGGGGVTRAPVRACARRRVTFSPLGIHVEPAVRFRVRVGSQGFIDHMYNAEGNGSELPAAAGRHLPSPDDPHRHVPSRQRVIGYGTSPVCSSFTRISTNTQTVTVPPRPRPPSADRRGSEDGVPSPTDGRTAGAVTKDPKTRLASSETRLGQTHKAPHPSVAAVNLELNICRRGNSLQTAVRLQ